MKLYNLYYKNMKINHFPIAPKAVMEILSPDRRSIKKMKNGQIIEIPTNKIEVIPVTIV
jgi:hypothetical protein